MGYKTQLFKLLPWDGLINTSLDSSLISPNQLIQADNAVFDTRGSRKKRDGINFDFDSGANSSASILAGKDFWYGVSSKAQKILAVHSDKKVYWYDSSGTRTEIALDGTATAWPVTPTDACITVLNNLAIISVDGAGNTPKKYSGSGNLFNLGGTPPAFSISRVHLDRLWTNDKTNKDRLNYSTTSNPEEWSGAGDSGAIDIGIGDGDTEGITAIFPSFKGVLYVAKRSKLYQIVGTTPDDFQVIPVSEGIGCISHNSISQIDESDMVFASERGFHSLAATQAYGDFTSTFLSNDIQRTFNDRFILSRRKYIKSAYIPALNGVAFAVTDSEIGSTYNNAIWFYNFRLKGWYRWPNIACQSIFMVDDLDEKRLYIGGNVGRLAKGQNGTNYDVSTTGSNTAILFKIKTGYIFPDDNPYLTKGFKKFALFYTPKGTHTVTITVQIDNYSPQSIAFSQVDSLALLGTNFELGSSSLGYTSVMAPYSLPIDGYGRGFQVTIEQSGITDELEIQGIGVEYQLAGPQQEVNTANS